MKQKVCEVWPDCACCVQLQLYGKQLQDERKIWDWEELEIGEMTIFINLACVSTHCPDPICRDYAKQQLRKPFWDRMKRKTIWVKQ
jgi:hypothetical protein